MDCSVFCKKDMILWIIEKRKKKKKKMFVKEQYIYVSIQFARLLSASNMEIHN